MNRPLALVTGVGPGTGSAIARRLSAGGYDVAMLARKQERLAALEREVANTKAFPCDVTDEAQIDATVDAVLRIRESDALMRDTPVIQAAIMLRNPYVDPLSLIQVSLLRRRLAGGGDNHEAADAVLSTTLSGIAQGLRNTG